MSSSLKIVFTNYWPYPDFISWVHLIFLWDGPFWQCKDIAKYFGAQPIFSLNFQRENEKDKFSACTVTQWKIKMQTIQYRRTRIWKMKKDEYTKTLAKNQVCEIFQMRGIGKNGLPKFIKLSWERHVGVPFRNTNYGRWIPTETSVFEFSY